MSEAEKIQERWNNGYSLVDDEDAMQLVEDVNTLFTLAPKELKHKKGKPTVIEYKGMRYVLDNR